MTQAPSILMKMSDSGDGISNDCMVVQVNHFVYLFNLAEEHSTQTLKLVNIYCVQCCMNIFDTWQAQALAIVTSLTEYYTVAI